MRNQPAPITKVCETFIFERNPLICTSTHSNFRFRVRMITWTLESYVLFILSLLSLSFKLMMNFVSPQNSKSPSLDKGTHEKGSRVATFPIPCSLCFYILSHAMFHALFSYIMLHILPLCINCFDVHIACMV